MAAKKKKKPYAPPTVRPISKSEAERIAGGPEELSALGAPYVHPPGEPVASLKMTVVVVEGDLDEATAGAIGNLIGGLLRR
jgi:hypothetical protein